MGQVQSITAVRALAYYELDADSSLLVDGNVHIVLPQMLVLDMHKDDRNLQVSDHPLVGLDSVFFMLLPDSLGHISGLGEYNHVSHRCLKCWPREHFVYLMSCIMAVTGARRTSRAHTFICVREPGVRPHLQSCGGRHAPVQH